MSKPMDGWSGDGWSVAYGQFIVKWRWMVILLSVLAAVGLGTGGRNLAFTSDYRVFFSDQNPQLQAYDRLQNVYSRTDNILFVLKPAEGTIFTPEWLAVVQKMTEASWQIPYSSRVDSITNFQNTEAQGDDLIVADLVESIDSLTPALLAKIQAIAQSEPALARRLISKDGKTTGINVTLQLPVDDQIALTEAVEFAEAMAARLEARLPNLEVAITGRSPLSNSFPRASIKDMSLLMPIMFGIIVVALIGFLHSFWGTAATLMVIILSVIAAMGTAGFMGVKLTPPAAIAPIIILTTALP